MSWTVRYVSVAGGGAHDGTSEANAWTLAEAIAAPYAAGQQINVKAGTYANTTTGRTFSVAGTTLAPVWWRGYKTTIGDLDDGVTVARSLQDGVNLPLITFTTGQMVISGAHHIFSNLDITSQCTTSGGAVNSTGGNLWCVGVRIENTANNAAARAITADTVAPHILYSCRFKANAGATYVVYTNISTALYGCHIIGGVNGTFGSTAFFLESCVIQSFVTSGLVLTSATAAQIVSHCTIYAAATNGILVSTIPTTGASNIMNCIIGGCTNGINNSTGGNTNGIRQFRNHFYSCTNNLVGITEMAAVTDNLGVLSRLFDNDTDPFVAKASSDFTLAAAAIDMSAGFPGIFEGQTAMVGYPDIGAVRHVDPAGGGMLRHPGMQGGSNA